MHEAEQRHHSNDTPDYGSSASDCGANSEEDPQMLFLADSRVRPEREYTSVTIRRLPRERG